MRINDRFLPALFGAIVVIAACSDSTRPRLQSPLVGKWELTTQLDTFTYETSGPSLPDCPNMTMYCEHYSPYTGDAHIGGTLEVSDATSSTDTLTKVVTASGLLQVSGCDAIDHSVTTGCSDPSGSAMVLYSGEIAGTPDTATVGSLEFEIGEPDDGSGFHLVLRSINLTFAGDSIYGPIYWGMNAGRHPSAFLGTIVLHRVH